MADGFAHSQMDKAAPRSEIGLVSRASPVQTAVRNCTRDEGGPFEVGNHGPISSRCKLLRSKAVVVSVAETSTEIRKIWSERLAHAPRRSVYMRIVDPSSGISSGDPPRLIPRGTPHLDGAKLIQALVRNVRTYTAMTREKAQAAPTARPKVPMRRSGADCSVVARKRV